jgi:hypothetical protein
VSEIIHEIDNKLIRGKHSDSYQSQKIEHGLFIEHINKRTFLRENSYVQVGSCYHYRTQEC